MQKLASKFLIGNTQGRSKLEDYARRRYTNALIRLD